MVQQKKKQEVGINVEGMKDSQFMKWKNHFNKLTPEEKEKVLAENKEYIIDKLTNSNTPIVGAISQFCSCFESGKISYCFNLKDSKKLFIYRLKSEDEEKIFKEGNIVSLTAHLEQNSYIVDLITLKEQFNK